MCVQIWKHKLRCGVFETHRGNYQFKTNEKISYNGELSHFQRLELLKNMIEWFKIYEVSVHCSIKLRMLSLSYPVQLACLERLF